MSRVLPLLFFFLPACASGPSVADSAGKEEARKAFRLGVSHVQGRRMLEAEGYFRQSIQLDPDYLEGYLGLGGLFTDLGRESEAVDIYESALSRLGERPEILEDLATAYERFGKPEQAVNRLRRALEIRSKMPDTPENREWIEKDEAGIKDLSGQ